MPPEEKIRLLRASVKQHQVFVTKIEKGGGGGEEIRRS